MKLKVPDLHLEGLQLVRVTLTPGMGPKEYDGQWVMFCSPLGSPGALVVSADFHEVSEGVLLGGTAHAIVRSNDATTASQAGADEAAEVLGPWLSEVLWDFLAGYLLPLAATSWGNFTLPQKAPTPTIRHLAELGGSDKE
ncbi:hypothetical protein [Pseudactinotalea sp. HY158]|uniref:hypothetical protein n=1 Tax=Pseudactinotalea sp. HY158 TaxID=2654547 RepID=UPI00129C321C|nr:hypothetical protein [Pseudactinotalea sp. HY158]QGH70783.1 hypothetical protein GCE65_15725 [Pseudactinotalea sp. HY158]